MINKKDQGELFKLISNTISKDISCFAVGGTAMMFHGYKETTQDIDLIFHDKSDIEEFIRVLTKLGYKEKAIFPIYSKERAKDLTKPKMFTRGEERFDLFYKKIFSFELPKEVNGRFDFIGDHNLIMYTPPPEWMIVMKIATNRDNDRIDILSICSKEEIDWDKVIDNIVDQARSEWILLDLEDNLRTISKKVFIKQRHFDKIYKGFEKKFGVKDK